MNRKMITGITLAAVAGSAGAAYASMTVSDHTDANAAAPQSSEVTTTELHRSYTYQAGPAGTVNLTADGDELDIDSTLPNFGWSVISSRSDDATVEVQLSDGTQIVTFTAELVGGDVVASLASSPVPTLATQPNVTPAPQPAVPPQTLAPSNQWPTSSHTSTPSKGDDDEHEDDENEDEHESEHESDDDDSEHGDD